VSSEHGDSGDSDQPSNSSSPGRTLFRSGRAGHDDTSGSFDRRLLAPMILGSVLNPVNSSILAVSLVPIGAAFGAPPSRTAWLVSGLYLATAIGQPVVGRLIDLYGPRRLYLAGTALVGVAGVVGLLAPSLGVLVLARVLLGFGTCAGYPAAMFLIRSEARRTGHNSPAAVLTALAVANQTVAVLGPVLGGLLIGLGGWRTTLAVNIPLAVAGLTLGLWRLPKTPVTTRREDPGSTAGIDLPGILTFATMLVALLLFLMEPRTDRWYLPALAVVAAAAFVFRERRAAEPFVDVRVLAGNLPLLMTYARTFLAYVVAYSTLYGYTQWLQEGRGLSASQAGLAQFPIFLTAILVSSTTGPRKGVRGKLLVGAAGQVVASALLFLLGDAAAVWLLVVVACVFGIPQGLNSLALQNSVYHQADPARIGSSAGLLRTFTYLGAMAASCANGVLFSHRADTAGLHRLAWFMLAAAAGFLVLTVADRSLSSLTKGDRP
jgi:MFS family permease